MAEGAGIMTQGIPNEPTHTGLIPATEVAHQTPARHSPNGIRFATFGDISTGPAASHADLDRLIQAVPAAIASALTSKTYYFVPLALAEARTPPATAPTSGHRTPHDETMISPVYTPELAEQAICHRNIDLTRAGEPNESSEGVFISTRLLSDRFSLAFEFFINVGHAFVDTAGIPESFNELAWNQALADVRGETSHDAWDTRNLALTGGDPTSSLSSLGTAKTGAAEGHAASSYPSKSRIDEKSKAEFLEAAFADAIAIYLLSLAVDFDYSELREREYPLLAPQPLAERLRLINRLFPPNPTYDFAIRYRRRP
jgi:hypothetical protein